MQDPAICYTPDRVLSYSMRLFLCERPFVGLVVKVCASRAEDTEFDSRLRRGDFSGSSHTSDLKIGTPVATLPDAWRYRVSRPSVKPRDQIWWKCSLFLGCLMSQYHAKHSPGTFLVGNFTCWPSETEDVDQTDFLMRSHCADTGRTSPSGEPKTSSVWQSRY